jgi:hypothetical protein
MSLDVHALYVRRGLGGAARQRTLELLDYIVRELPALRAMGVRVVARAVDDSGGSAPAAAALRARGVKSLPALVTPNNVYEGVAEIGQVYAENLAAFRAARRAAAAPEDDLRQQQMAALGAGDDNEEQGVGEEGDIMKNYQAEMQRRSLRAPKAGGPGGGGPPGPGPGPADDPYGGRDGPGAHGPEPAPRAPRSPVLDAGTDDYYESGNPADDLMVQAMLNNLGTD